LETNTIYSYSVANVVMDFFLSLYGYLRAFYQEEPFHTIPSPYRLSDGFRSSLNAIFL
ncbi:hypothetical protein HAX54_050699, partial [Datura stramonium]|nr:hypothetical protein [Datura stramonium]